MDAGEQERRFQAIETKLTFLEDFLLRLQEETSARHVVLDRIEAEHRALKTRLLQVSRCLELMPPQKPPHY
jgi:SlyX protein